MQTLHREFYGFSVLGHVAALILLVFVLLQALADLLLIPGRRGRAIASQAIVDGVQRWNEAWVKAYRGEVEGEWRGLREPLDNVRGLLSVDEAGAMALEAPSEVQL